MYADILDAISNIKIGRSKVIRADDKTLVLSNSNGEARVLLDLAKRYRIKLDDESYIGSARAIKATKRYVIVRISGYGMVDRRRFIRVPCSYRGKLYTCGGSITCVINEIAYASCVINCEEKLLTGEDATVMFSSRIVDLAVNGIIQMEIEQEEQEQDEIWFNGYNYIISFDNSDNLATTKDNLYGFIRRLMLSSTESTADLQS